MNNINFSNTSNTNGHTYIYKENYGNNKIGINEGLMNYSKDSDEIYHNNNNNNNNNNMGEMNKRKEENIKSITHFARYLFFIAKKIAYSKDSPNNNLCADEEIQKSLVKHLIYKLNKILSSLLNFNVLQYNENEKNIKQEIEYVCLKNSNITLNKIRYMLKKLDNSNIINYKYILYILLKLKEYDDKNPPKVPDMDNKNINNLSIHHNNNFVLNKHINDNNKNIHNMNHNDKIYTNNLHNAEDSSVHIIRNTNEKDNTIKEHTTNITNLPNNIHNNYNLNNHNINKDDTNHFHQNNYPYHNNALHNFNQINQEEYEENKKHCKLINKNDNKNTLSLRYEKKNEHDNFINNNKNSIILHKNNLVNKSLYANIILNNKFHSLDVEENFLLRDLIYPLQGIDGEFIKYNKREKIFCVHNRKVSLGMQHLINNIGSVGLLFKKIKTFISYSNVDHRRKISVYDDSDNNSSDLDDFDHYDKHYYYNHIGNHPNGHSNEYTNNTSNNLQQLKFKLHKENYIPHNTDNEKIENRTIGDIYKRGNANGIHMNTQGNVDDIHMNTQGNVDDIHMNTKSNVDHIHMNTQSNVDHIHMNTQGNIDDIHMNTQGNIDNIHMNAQGNIDDNHMNSHVKNGKLLNCENKKGNGSKLRIKKYRKGAYMVSKKGSLVIDALYQVIREYMNEYYKLLSYIESDINEHIHKNTVYIGIKKLYLLLQESYKILRVLVGVIDESLRNTGCTFLSYLYSKSQTYDYEEQKIYKKILQRCIKPINEILKHWIEYGVLKDKYNETFIASNKIVNSEEIWLNKFYLNVNKIPLFLSFSIAKKILMTGKSVYLLNTFINNNVMNNYMKGAYVYNNSRDNYISSMLNRKSLNYNKHILLKGHKKGDKDEDECEDESEDEKKKIDYIKKKGNKNDEMYEDPQRGVKKKKKKKKKLDGNNNNNNNNNNYYYDYYKNDSLYYSHYTNKKKYSEYKDDYIEDEDYDEKNMIDVFSINDISMYIENIDDYINKISQRKNKNLINVLLNNYNLYENFQAFRHFLLLVDGDLFETLFDNMKNDLYMNAEELKRHYLNSKLDLCIKSSSLFTENSNIINKLTLDKFNMKRGDTGWDVLVFDYLVEKPLDIIFTKKIKNIYKSINILLIKLKKIQCELSNMWYLFTHLFKIINIIYYNSLFNFCNIIRNEMFHFIQNILSYFYYDVIDTNWHAFKKKIFLCNNLDQLIKAHYNYITQIQYDLFLGNYHDLILSARRKYDPNNHNNHNSYHVLMNTDEEANYLYNDYSSSYTNTPEHEYLDMDEYYLNNHNLNIYKNPNQQQKPTHQRQYQDHDRDEEGRGKNEYKRNIKNKYKNDNEEYIHPNVENESHKCLNKILDIITRFINITTSLVSLICEHYNEIKKLIQERKDIDMEEKTHEKNNQHYISDDSYQNHDNYIDYINYYVNYKIIGEATIKDIKMLLKYYRNYIYKFICLLLGENKFLYMYSKNTNRDKLSSLRLLASRLDFNLYYVRLSKGSDRKTHPTKLNISKRINMMNT
ncbi:gamma-tubulin complex component, putative [Plasmodium reichenowi]|uniref:Gamma-tubulin complex component, putative n=1 Tax=Plasmodium reichenowi TaxID=5854 RepID=A0A151LI63_PLARE|nr:gamma-tubulin complex component, putative [Plasmodium reichenowi]KYN98634.1 gamma-tubulin complex component, putative [Plasmodium reichenowi]